jgi:hypothetical protein
LIQKLNHFVKNRTIRIILSVVACCVLAGCLPVYGEPLPARGAVDGKWEGAAGERGRNDVVASPYYPASVMTAPRLSGTLIRLQGLRAWQQTSERSCGAACALMALAHFGDDKVTEDDLAREMNIRGAGNPRPDGSYGCATDAMVRAFRARSLAVTSSADTQNEKGASFNEPGEFADFVRRSIQSGTVILVENVEWGGHWRIIAGYDNMGTQTLADDVLLFADPYDTTDHRQDGWTIQSLERFFYEWFDAGILPENQRIQQYVAVSRRP